MRFRLLRCLARAIVKNGLKLACNVIPGMGAVYEVAADTWEEFNKDQRDDALRAEVQGLAQAPLEQVRQDVQQAVEAEAANQPAEVRQALTAYLTQVPAAIRRSLRRPSDPTGTTVPPTMALKGAEDLMTMLPPRPPRFKPGDRPLGIGDWELEELLGMGGFGEVWKARHAHMRSKPPVALKFCLEQSAAAALRNEVGVLDRVMQHGRHQGIVPLLQTYLSANPPCLEYELVEGGDLSGLIQELHGRKQLTVDLANRFIHNLVEIVAHAHRSGIVHGDLKPANVLVRRVADGKLGLRVTDFGIGGLTAALAIRETRQPTRSRPELVTEAVRGAYTPLYASPEQMVRRKGELADPRDDVHALGVIWYQLVTGDLGMMSMPTDWWMYAEKHGLDAKLIRLLGECMASEAGRRPDNAVGLGERLRAALPGKAKTAGEPRLKMEPEPLRPSRRGQTEPPPLLPGEQDLDRQFETSMRGVEQANAEARRLAERLHDYGAAEKILEKVPEHLRDEALVAKMRAKREEQANAEARRLAEKARRLAEKQHEYGAAVQVLEKAAVHLRDGALLAELRAKRDRVDQLDREVRQAVRDTQVAGLRPKVAALLELLPQRDDLRRLLEKLPRERQAGEVFTLDLGKIRSGGFLGLGAKTVGVRVKFAWCPPGTFLMGSPESEPERSDNETQHRVTLTKGFWLGVTPVTQAQWRAIRGSNPSHFKGDDHPVGRVSWDDCQVFCAKLRERTGKTFRLPTEAEWEYACRAGTTTPYSFGDSITSEQVHYEGKMLWGKDLWTGMSKAVYRDQTKPVGSFPANAWGLYDMHGSVWEWCNDWYGPYPSGDQKDPRGSNSGDTRVVRGGHCCASWCRSAYRFEHAPSSRIPFVSCRLVFCVD